MPELIFPKLKKGDKVVLVLHGGTRVPATVLGPGNRYEKTGKLDVMAEDLPAHVAHLGTTQAQRVRGKIDPDDRTKVIGGTFFEETESPRVILTDAPFDPLGRQSDSWHEMEETPAAAVAKAQPASGAAAVAK